jgi:hypothetical protein
VREVEPVAPTASAEVTDADRVDPRVRLDPDLPLAVANDPTDLLRWARTYAEHFVLDEDAAQAVADRRVRREAWHRLMVEEKRQAVRTFRVQPGVSPLATSPPPERWPRVPGENES